MKGKKYVFILMICVSAIIFLYACSAKERMSESEYLPEIGLPTAPDSMEQELTEEQTIEQTTISLEMILVDFPFPYGMSGYTLALMASSEKAGRYDLQVCNEYGLVEQMRQGDLL